jgi:hypothetical protein
MGWRMMKAIVSSLLLFFIGINIFAFAMSGWEGFVAFVQNANGWTVLAVTDLCIALTLVASWMVRDARARGRSVAGYLVLTLFAGSIGPLVYLLNRD